MIALNEKLLTWQQRINEKLDHWLPSSNLEPQRLHEAMRYSVLNGGKRLRPSLVYAAGEAVGAEPNQLDAPACAVELIHAYSLIHDDMPAMDDDDLRRGRPTCHIAFDEATALLAGDALQSFAFQLLADTHLSALPNHNRILMLKTLAHAIGSQGMAGGQALDMHAEGKSMDLPYIEKMHRLKTGALILASVQLGALAVEGTEPKWFEQLTVFAADLGLAFQIQDDILDIESSTEVLGKQQGKDQQHNKSTYPSIAGLDYAKKQVKQLHDKAIQALKIFGDEADQLRQLADYVILRNH